MRANNKEAQTAEEVDLDPRRNAEMLLRLKADFKQ